MLFFAPGLRCKVFHGSHMSEIQPNFQVEMHGCHMSASNLTPVNGCWRSLSLCFGFSRRIANPLRYCNWGEILCFTGLQVFSCVDAL